MNDIQTLNDLNTILISNGINVSKWGLVKTKSMQNLLTEIIGGEVYLQTNPLLRIIQVVKILIRKGNYVLIEIEQEFGNGQKRSRKFPPAEKMKPGETYIDAALRCLQEEFGIIAQDVQLIESTYWQEKMVIESPSYPQLQTQYTFHNVEAIVSGLPDTKFWTLDAAHALGDPVKRHHWDWLVSDT